MSSSTPPVAEPIVAVTPPAVSSESGSKDLVKPTVPRVEKVGFFDPETEDGLVRSPHGSVLKSPSINSSVPRGTSAASPAPSSGPTTSRSPS